MQIRWLYAFVIAVPAAMVSAELASAPAFAQEATSEAGSHPPVQAGLAVDWTTGPTFGNVPTLGGTHGLGVEGQLAAFGALELDARYELLAIPLSMDMGTDVSHQLFGQLKARWITDDVRHQLWAIGVGYGTAFRTAALGGRAAVGRVSLTRQIGIPNQQLDLAFELAYERSFGDTHLDMALGSIRFGYATGAKAKYNGPKAPVFQRTTSFDVFYPWGAGMTFGLHANAYLSLETSASYIADIDISSDNVDHHGFRGAQWAALSGPRVQSVRWPLPEAVFYGQLQGGVGWIARDPGELRAVQAAEIGIRLPCSDWGVELGAWVRTQVADGSLDPLAGGLVLRFIASSDRIAIGGRNRKCADAGSGGSAPVKSETVTTTDLTIGAGLDALQNGLHVPAARVETVQPRAGFFWIAGHWEWRGSAWEWVGGRWEAERSDMRWTPGRYEVRGNVKVWIDGSWVAR
ncbi:MAG TPA: YXWGXW repeat-containing protein [Kofleriaceae bacterium]|jgi:hypothetical protein|nr:YXWGXW repeat-containing protein [Kofleriaceae bacterium]